MKRWIVVLGVVVLGLPRVWAHEAHEHAGKEHAGEEHAGQAMTQEAASSQPAGQALTGEVVDVFCYLSHGKDGLGAGHAGCAKKCIKSGLPVALKVGEQLYLATMADHTAANAKLVDLAGQQVTVTGTVMEKDGQHLIAITSVETAQ